jgi:HEAT repeat protein
MTSPDVDAILRGDPTEAIEAAKRIILDDSVSPDVLAGIAADKDRKIWSRVAAIYALGFIDDASISGAALVGILADRNEPEECRSHAAEALGHVKHKQAVPTMEAILASDDPPDVKSWCTYALTEIGGRRARAILQKFTASHPGDRPENEPRTARRR